MVNDINYEHYLRQIRLQEVGVLGQKKINEAKVLIIGLGALGTPNVQYLAAAGVGTIGIVEGDVIEISNLHRQVLYNYTDINRSKSEATKEYIQKINPNTIVKEYNVFLTTENALEIIDDYDIVINGTDNFPTRYLINDACVLLSKPLVDASILRFSGQVTIFKPGLGCYRCLFPTPPAHNTVPNCTEVGVLGPVAGHIGSLQAVETLKLILEIGKPLNGRLVVYDALKGRHITVDYNKDKNCPICGIKPSIKKLINYEEFCGVPKKESLNPQAQVTENGWSLNPSEVNELTKRKAIQVIDIRPTSEYVKMHIEDSESLQITEIFENLSVIDGFSKAVLVCHSGEKSSLITLKLRELGLSNVFNMYGGINLWLFQNLHLAEKRVEAT